MMNKVEKNSERRPSEAASQGPLPDSENGKPENGTLDGTPTEQAEPMADGDLTPGRARINRQEDDYNAKQMFNMATGKETRKRRRVEDTEEGKAEEADAATIRESERANGLRGQEVSGADDNRMDVDPTDEIKLHGGIHINGCLAELVDVKVNGQVYFVATGKPVDPIEDSKPQASHVPSTKSEELEDEEEILRSMARRKKTEGLDLRKCSEPGCNKEFKRKADLSKHEKAHSRPWKCPVSTCKYHKYGWPTKKEMDRHHNDQHSAALPIYKCPFEACTYESKRESNCNQHMEKKHGWHYVRSKSSRPRPAPEGLSTPDLTPEQDGKIPAVSQSLGQQNGNAALKTWPDVSTDWDGRLPPGPLLHETGDSGPAGWHRRQYSVLSPQLDDFNTETMPLDDEMHFKPFPDINTIDPTYNEFIDFDLFPNIHHMDTTPTLKSKDNDPSPAAASNIAATDSGYASLGRPNKVKTPEDVPQDYTSAGSEVDCATTVYSLAQSVSEDDVEMYTLQFAESLADFVASETAKGSEDPQLVEGLARSLPRLLRAFALRLGCEGSNKTEREVMFFIHKHRNNIASRFQSALMMDSQSLSSGSSSRDQREKVDMSAAHAFIREWLDGLGSDNEYSIQMPDLDETIDAATVEEGDNGVALPNKRDYTKIVFESASYLWLTAAVKRELSLAPVPGQEGTLGNVYNKVLRSLEAGRKEVSSRRPSERFTLHLTADWNPAAFLRQQFAGSTEPLGTLLARTITLTGSATDAQALPCEVYIRQTWPASGSCLLPILKRALDSGGECEGLLPDKTFVKLQVGACLWVEVQGSSDSIAEVAEQVAWLSAALRTSETDDELSLCLPSISIGPYREGLASSFACTLHFPTRKASRGPKAEAFPGQCWHKLFRNPVVVEGFPIPRRSRYGSGLEIPLNMMSRLTESPRIHQYFGKHLLKGFSTAVFPTDTMDDALLWHLHCTDDGSRLPYPDLEGGGIQCVDTALDEMASQRHILGWCSEASVCAGSKGMNYDIKGTKLKSPGKAFSLEKVSFSVGQIVTGGCQFSIGHKDMPVRITREGYIAKLRWIRQRYFTLWDVDDKRGWLVDGASTLLHLLRASLYQSSTDDFATEFIFDESRFCEPSQPYKTGVALDVLLNRTNRALDLYREEQKTEIVERVLPNGRIESMPHTRVRTTTIQDRVEELYETLEKLVDHKHRVEVSYEGANAKPRVRDRLEGWDFADLAGDRDPFHLKVTTLPTHAINMTWVDYTCAIPAVTLFGRGFGDLIRPSTDASSCHKQHGPQQHQICRDWALVPKDQHYLCVSAADLQKITDRIGDASTNPVTLAPGITWHTNSSGASPFNKCACEQSDLSPSKRTPLHPIQELAPSAMNFLYSKDTATPPDLSDYPNGALIFGTPMWKWPWKTPTPSATATTTTAEQGSEKQKVKDSLLLDLSHKTCQALSFTGSSSSSNSQDLSLSRAGSGSATPPTSITSESEGSSTREEQTQGGALTGGKRRAWWSSNGDGAGGDDLREGEESGGGGGRDFFRRLKRARGK